MKRFLIIFLLFASVATAQWKPFDWYGATDRPIIPVVYTQRAVDFFTRVELLGKTLTTGQKGWYNDSIFVPLLDSGLIGTTRAGDSIAVLYALPKFAGDTTILKLNLLDTAYTLTSVGTVTWSDSGAVGNGTSSYLNTNFNPILDSSIYKLNSASFGIYSKTDTASGGTHGVRDGTKFTYFNPRYTTNQISDVRINSGNLSLNPANSNSKGTFIISRQSVNFNVVTLNGETKGTSTGASIGIPNNKIYISAVNNSGSSAYFDKRVISFAFIGSGLSVDKSRKLSNILNNSLKSRNYNVY